MYPLRTILIPKHTMATEVLEEDMPVNPVSHLIITMAGYNVTDEATLAEIIAFINSIKVLQGGKIIFSLESEQAAAVNWYLFGSPCMLHNNVATDNAERILGLIVPFGRKLYNAEECFPASRKGEFKLQIDTTIPSSSLDNGIIAVDAVELLDANPSRYLKCSAAAVSAPGQTGENQIPLPIGNKFVSLLIGHTSYTLTGSHTLGINGYAIEKNGTRDWYAEASCWGAITERMLLGNAIQRDIAAFGQQIPDKYTCMDFNPTRDNELFLESKGLSSLNLILDMGVDEACTVTKLELVDVK